LSTLPAICVIPARWTSTRFPGKPLADLGSKPMIEWVCRQAEKASQIDEVLVATDDDRIFQAVKKFGGKAVMTSEDCSNGTERVAEAVQGRKSRVIVNLQGDEPFIEPADLDALVEVFDKEPEVQMATLARAMKPEENEKDPNRVKVVFDRSGFALYFSRSPIPYQRQPGEEKPTYYLHYGLYAFRPETLKRLVQLPESTLEKAEKLEQLRALQAGVRIRTLLTDSVSEGIDTPEDLERVRKLLK